MLATELGEDESRGLIRAVCFCSGWAPIREGQELLDFGLWRCTLRSGEAVCNLQQNLGQTRGWKRVEIGLRLFTVIELA